MALKTVLYNNPTRYSHVFQTFVILSVVEKVFRSIEVLSQNVLKSKSGYSLCRMVSFSHFIIYIALLLLQMH